MKLAFDNVGWLQESAAVIRVPTVRTCALEVTRPLGIVWHGTGGPCRDGYGERLALRIQTYRKGLDRTASWHLLVSRTGCIYQSAPLSRGTWHVGRRGIVSGKAFGNVNKGTVGVELENPGRLARLNGRYYCWPYFLNPAAPRHERRPDPRYEVPESVAVRCADGTLFSNIPEPQESASLDLLAAVAVALGIGREGCSYTHRQFDPGRKEDPGRHFETVLLPRMLDAAFAREAPAEALAEAQPKAMSV